MDRLLWVLCVVSLGLLVTTSVRTPVPSKTFFGGVYEKDWRGGEAGGLPTLEERRRERRRRRRRSRGKRIASGTYVVSMLSWQIQYRSTPTF